MSQGLPRQDQIAPVSFHRFESDFEGFRTLTAAMTLAAALAVAVAERRREMGRLTANPE